MLHSFDGRIVEIGQLRSASHVWLGPNSLKNIRLILVLIKCKKFNSYIPPLPPPSVLQDKPCRNIDDARSKVKCIWNLTINISSFRETETGKKRVNKAFIYVQYKNIGDLPLKLHLFLNLYTMQYCTSRF